MNDIITAISASPYLPAAFASIALAVLILRDATTGILSRVSLVLTCAVAALAVSLPNMMTQFLLLEAAWVFAVLAIWLGGGENVYRCGVRVAMWHIVSGALVLAGVAFTFGKGDVTGGLTLNDQIGPWLLLAGLGIRAGFPLAHIWPVDVATHSSRATLAVAATVLPASALSILAAMFGGADVLVWIGAIMIAIAVIYGLLEQNRNIRCGYLIGGLFGVVTLAIGLSLAEIIGVGLAVATIIGGALAILLGEEREGGAELQLMSQKGLPDFDVVTLRVIPAIFFFVLRFGLAIWEEIVRGAGVIFHAALETAGRIYGPEGRASRLMSTGTMVLWLAILLGATLSVNLLELR